MLLYVLCLCMLSGRRVREEGRSNRTAGWGGGYLWCVACCCAAQDDDARHAGRAGS